MSTSDRCLNPSPTEPDRHPMRRIPPLLRPYFLFQLFGAALALGTPATTTATSCDVPPLPDGALQRAAARLGEPVVPLRHAAAWRLGALLPARLQVRRNDGVTLGIGEILATSGDASERSSALRSASWSVALTWELDRLWEPPPLPVLPDPLVHADRARRLFERLAALRARHALVRAEARGIVADSPRCWALQGEAEAIDWALRAILRLPQTTASPPTAAPAAAESVSRPPPPPAAPPARPPSAAR